MSVLDGASPTAERRFWEKVEPGPDDHWLWTGAMNAGGYGNFRLGHGRYATPQRVAFELEVRPLLEGERLYRNCTELRCVNPAHWDIEREE